MRTKPYGRCPLSQRNAVNQFCPGFGKWPLFVRRELHIQLMGENQLQNRIAKELQSLVGWRYPPVLMGN